MRRIKYMLAAAAVLIVVVGCSPKSHIDEELLKELEYKVNQEYVNQDYLSYFEDQSFTLTKGHTAEAERIEDGLVKMTFIHVNRDVNQSFESLDQADKEEVMRDLEEGLATPTGQKCGRDFPHYCILKGVKLHSESNTYSMEWNQGDNQLEMVVSEG
ncbi:hypothetical protein H0266_14215 [Halobacillus locisalis]|uniref:DUF5590 domain-containing protein n=1 Tax=Halobacillus locisalis TaxID=220753 RepID=A0A838CVT5_9BACI|nr:hypothetical protein [Halobacillus locisalis]MBA2176048.1 hypothetical protein [Halobacillus locisalis]